MLDILGWLTIFSVGLKLIGFLTCSWLIVLIPLWIGLTGNLIYYLTRPKP